MSFTTRPVETGHGSVIDRRSAHRCRRLSGGGRPAGRSSPLARPLASRLPHRLLPNHPSGGHVVLGLRFGFRPAQPEEAALFGAVLPGVRRRLGTLPDVAAGRDEVPVRAPLDALAALMRAAAAG